MVQLVYDATDFFRLSRAFARLPEQMRTVVAARAMRRVASMGATRVVRRVAERINVPQGVVRERTNAFELDGHASIHVRSDWIPLFKLGAKETRTGVTVRARGSYRAAFIATMASGHQGVMKREGKPRLPIRELYGPNPANDIATSPDVYQLLIDDLAANTVMPRMLHELGRILPK